jgi:DNA-binding NarL/FixJ family response regulator
MHVFVVERHPIFRRGLADCLRELDGVDGVFEAGDVGEATAHDAFAGADLVFVDHELPGAGALLRELGDAPETDVIVLVAGAEDDVLDAVQSGAIGFLAKDTLTPDALAGAVHAAANGTTVIAPTLLAGLAHRRITGGGAGGPGVGGAAVASSPGGAGARAGNGAASTAVAARRGSRDGVSWLTAREQQVLSLIAEGHPTREVAEQLCYSERTVKNVLHDIVTKLGARSRSQAVAHAVRDGLI